MKNVIYKLTSPSGKSYIGLTTTFKKRMSEHKRAKDKHIIHRAIRKYGFETFTKEILIEIREPKLLPELEKFYINKFNTYKNGYNSTLGGEGTLGLIFSNEHKKKISNKLKDNKNSVGAYRSKETRKKISSSMKNIKRKPHSIETKRKISEANTGKVLSDETKLKLSVLHQGKKHSEETKQKMSIAAKNRKK